MREFYQESSQPPGHEPGKASDESIVRTHARIRRTPIEGSPVAFFSALALIVVLTFSWFYWRRHMAEFDKQAYVQTREDAAQLTAWIERPRGPIEYDYYAIGEELYSTCVACHGPDGQGQPPAFPPLAGSEWVVSEDPALPTKILLAGLQGPITVKGEPYNGVMAAFGAGWEDHQVAGIVTYIRQTWGNEASGITAEEVAAIREEVGDRGPYTGDELASYLPQ